MYIKLKNIQKQYNHHIVLKDVTLTIDKPGIYYIKGKSGSGKTTLFHIIAGFETFENGSREANDCRIATIFQSYELIDELTVKENIELVQDVFDNQDMHFIEVLGLTSLLDHYPHELSGGQKQRVGILRALLTRPQIILCDEPTVSLDYENRKVVLDLLEELSKECAVIISSHNEQELVSYIDYIYEIKDQHVYMVKDKKISQSLKPVQHSLHMNKLKKYMNKMLPAQRKMLIFFSIIIGVLGLLLIQIERQVFHPTINERVRNSQILYIKNYHSNPINDTPLVLFEPLLLNNKYYQINVYPYVDNPDFKDVHLQENEIQINQYMEQLLSSESLINQPLTLQYELDGKVYEETFIIKDVIEEDISNHQPQIYYNYNYFIQRLRSKYHSHKYKTQYDYFINNCSLYQLQSDNVKKDFERYNSNNRLTVYNSVYTPYYQRQNQSIIYHIIYIIVETIVIGVGNIFILYQYNKYINSMKYRLSILASLSLPFKKLKHMHMLQCFKKDLFMIIVMMFEMIIYYFIMKATVINIILSIGLMMIMVFVDLGFMFIKMNQYHYKDIATILKDDKI